MKFLSNIVSAASGSVAGLTFSRNKGGNYCRARSVPSNPNTIRQAASRDAMSAASTKWATLDPTIQAAWNDYAAALAWTNALGQSIKLSGQQAYIRAKSIDFLSKDYFTNEEVMLVTSVPSTNDLGVSPAFVGAVAFDESTGLFTSGVVDGKGVGEEDKLAIVIRGSRPAQPGTSVAHQPSRIIRLATADFETEPDAYSVPLTGTNYPWDITGKVGHTIRITAQVLHLDGTLSAKVSNDTIIVA